MKRIVHRWAIVTALIAFTLVLGSSSALAAWYGESASVDPTEAAPGDTVTFTATIAFAPDEVSGASADFSTNIPAAFTGVSWSCSGSNFVCDATSGSGNDISVSGAVTETGQAATATVTITATVAADAPAGPVDTTICIVGSTDTGGSGLLYTGGVRALPLLQEGCPTATVTITVAEEPTPTPTEPAATPEPTETATAEPTPATPIASQTVTPGEPAAPTQTAPVTQLPSTGAGNSGANGGLLATIGVIAVFAMGALGLAGLRLRRRS